jgi:hypothetical protein
VGEKVEEVAQVAAPASMVRSGKCMIRFADLDPECSSVNIYQSVLGNQHSSINIHQSTFAQQLAFAVDG